MVKGDLGCTCAGVGWSTKLQAVLDELDFVNREHPGDKVVIFSQFTSFLDIVQAALRVRREAHDGDVRGGGEVSCGGGKVARLDGSMPRAKRSLAIAAFTNDADTDVLLVSIKAGGTGLNLVSANHVFITDLWWNSAVEAQVCVCHATARIESTSLGRA
jgi:DNA repair protein RAD5